MKIQVDVLRLDLFHPVVSGNKWFKLKYAIFNAVEQKKTGLFSFGGAYSNHLVAMSYACKEHGLLSAAIIRGQDDPTNHSLNEMRKNGMRLTFTGREQYRGKNSLSKGFIKENESFYYVPEGGLGEDGVKGAGEILTYAQPGYTDIFCSVGTGTTLAGLITAAAPNARVTGISAIKVKDKDENDLSRYIEQQANGKPFDISFDYHFGGYAKKTAELLAFMNSLYETEGIPTDFVYTGKMFFAVNEMIRNNYFVAGSKLLLVHTGGLQGNLSLPPGTLVF